MNPTGGISERLAWWRAHPDASDAQLRGLLAEFAAWKARHDQDRAGQPGPFLQLAWDAVFGDEHEKVTEAIGRIEAALAKA